MCVFSCAAVFFTPSVEYNFERDYVSAGETQNKK